MRIKAANHKAGIKRKFEGPPGVTHTYNRFFDVKIQNILKRRHDPFAWWAYMTLNQLSIRPDCVAHPEILLVMYAVDKRFIADLLSALSDEYDADKYAVFTAGYDFNGKHFDNWDDQIEYVNKVLQRPIVSMETGEAVIFVPKKLSDERKRREKIIEYWKKPWRKALEILKKHKDSPDNKRIISELAGLDYSEKR